MAKRAGGSLCLTGTPRGHAVKAGAAAAAVAAGNGAGRGGPGAALLMDQGLKDGQALEGAAGGGRVGVCGAGLGEVWEG